MKNLILLCLSVILFTGCAGTSWQTNTDVGLNSGQVSFNYEHRMGKSYERANSWRGDSFRREYEWNDKRGSLYVNPNPVYVGDTYSYGPGAQLVWPTVPTLGSWGTTQPLSGQHGTTPIRQ